VERKSFNLIHTPLSGFNLIEASAGTGKTYNITKLVIRLILENKLSITDILIVTFTNAATFELQTRIRNELYDTYNYFSQFQNNQTKENDIWINYLYNYFSKLKDEQKNLVIKRIKTSLNDFQNANIFTIHSFCNKILKQYAFEANSSLKSELLKDEISLFEKYAKDFYRKYILNNEYDIIEFIGIWKDNSKIYKTITAIPDKYKNTDNSTPEHILQAINERIFKIKSIYTIDGLARSNTKKLNELSIKLGYGINLENLIKDFKSIINIKFNPDKFPEDKYIEIFNLMYEIKYELIPKLYFHLQQFIKRNFENELQIKSQFTFDNLLIKVAEAVYQNNNLISELRNKYKAVLIDEFQDTDKLQFKIFDTVFFRNNNTCSFIIGDPKQSIYRFRGADIYSYLIAAQKAQNSYTLKNNYRSDAKLLEAFNIFFNVDNPFFNEKIIYDIVKTPEDNPKRYEFFLDEHKEKPFTIINVEGTQDNIKTQLANFITNEILKFLKLRGQNKAFLNDKLLNLSDIAILVKSHSEAEYFQKMLSKHNIKSIINSKKSIFETEEAINLYYILNAIINNQNIQKLKLALLVKLINFDKNKIVDLENNDILLEKIILKFTKLYNIWNQKGFIVMFENLLEEFQVIQNINKFTNKERILTNLFQLQEILHIKEKELRYSPNDLLNYLQKRIKGEDFDDIEGENENLLRLESDDDAVKIQTIHSSKGLEFPIVFIPSILKISKNITDYIYHIKDENEEYKTILNFAFEENETIKKEYFEELLRLLYVAITRAKYKCYLCNNNINENVSNASDEKEISIKKVNEYSAQYYYTFRVDSELKRFYDNPNLFDIINLNKNFTIKYDSDDEKFYKNEFKIEKIFYFEKEFQQYRKILSYSSISKSKIFFDDDFDIFDYDIYKPNEDNQLPKGNITGLYIHKIFEKYFANRKKNIDDIIKSALDEFSIDEKYFETTKKLVVETLEFTLNNKIKIKNIEKCIPEMTFYYPIRWQNIIDIIKSQDLSEMATYFKDNLLNVDTSKLYGYLNGIIDLFFEYDGKYYIIDWKTNSLENYGNNDIIEEMYNNFYFLQYHLYTFAIDRHLRNNLTNYDYDKDFGGIFYIFVRGINNNETNGIFFDKPDKQLVELFNKIY